MKRNVVVITVIAALLGLGVWVYQVYQKSLKRDAVLARVVNAGERLRGVVTSAPTGESVDIDAHARAVEAHAAALRESDTSGLLQLADAADDYLVTAREILRRRAAMQSSHERLAKSVEGFRRHLQADRGAAAWTQQAVSLKAPIDRDLREFRIASESYATLLESLPASQAKIAPYAVGAVLLDDKAVKAAQERALDALARTDENVRQVARLEAYRGGRAAPHR